MLEAINKILLGRKTAIGIIAGIGAFLVVVAQTLTDGFQLGDVQVLLGGFSALMVAIGLGDKAQRILNGLGK